MTTATVSRENMAFNVEDVRVEELRIDGIDVSITYASASDERVSREEIRAYIERGNRRNVNTTVQALQLDVDGEDVEIHYQLTPVSFDRIRRITGYLVGTMDRWNDAKSAEEHDRVKHGVPSSGCGCCCGC